MKLISTLDKYVFFEMIIPFCVSMLLCLSIFVMMHLLEVADIIINHGAELISVCLLVFYGIPYFLQYVIPMSIMMAVLMVCLRMSNENEILVLKVSGISIFKLIRPVFLFSMIAVSFTGVITMYIIPKSEKLFKTLSRDMVASGISMSLKERSFNSIADGSMLYIGQIDNKNGDMHDILIEDTETAGITNTIVAPKGKFILISDEMLIYLKLFDGSIGRVDVNKKFIHRMKFHTHDIQLDIKNYLLKAKLSNTNVKQMNLYELKAFIDLCNGQSRKCYEAVVQYYKVFAIPFSCLPMGFLALSLGVYGGKLRTTFGVGLGVVSFLIYYILLSIGVTLGESGIYHPLIGVWLPNFIMGLLGLILLKQAVNEKFPPISFLKPISTSIDLFCNIIRGKRRL